MSVVFPHTNIWLKKQCRNQAAHFSHSNRKRFAILKNIFIHIGLLPFTNLVSLPSFVKTLLCKDPNFVIIIADVLTVCNKTENE